MRSMKTFWKGQVQLLVFYFLITGCYCLVVWLYQQPKEIILTCFLMSLPVLVGFLCYRWHNYSKARRLLAGYEFDPSLYPAQDRIYIDTLNKLKVQNREISEKDRQEQKELLDYFSLWAHQTKLPLSVLRLLCCQEPLDTESIRLQMRRLDQYVEMAMAYVRLESSSDYKIKNQPLDPIVKNAIRHFSTEFIHKKIFLDYTPQDLEVLSDSKWLEFVIEQILANALRYTPERGEIRIYVKDEILYIQDTGCGIDPSDLPRIFEQGFSGFNGHQDDSSSGIGLYLCQKILKRLGHAIHIESRLKIGTTVAIDLHKNSILPE